MAITRTRRQRVTVNEKSITITGEREDLCFKYDKMMIKRRNEL